MNTNLNDDNFHYICSECTEKYKKLFKSSGILPKVGDMVKVIFKGQGGSEHMWVELTQVSDQVYQGVLKNDPQVLALKFNETVDFKLEDIIMCLDKDLSEQEATVKILQTMEEIQINHFDKHVKL